MKWWTGLLISGLSAATGFFGGMLFERRKKKKAEPVAETPKEGARVVVLDPGAAGADQKSLEEVLKTIGYYIEDEKFDAEETSKNMEKALREMEGPEEDDEEGPCVKIDSDEWYSNADDYAQVSLAYYTEDDILSDLDGACPSKPEELIGRDNMIDLADDPDWETIYIRNPGKRILIKIDRVIGSWSEAYGDVNAN